MVVRTIEMLLEYVCIMLCIYKAAKQEIRVNIWMCFILVLEWLLIIAIDSEIIAGIAKVITYIGFLFYIKYAVVENWELAIKIYGTMIITIVVLQILIFIVLVSIYPNMQYLGICVNLISCFMIGVVKEKFEKVVVKRFSSVKVLGLIILVYSLIFFRLFWIYSKTGYVNVEESIRFAVETVVLNILFVLWFHAENISKNKAKELQMYQMYNKAFEETINTIRLRQHEFENHINAIKCMKYTINDTDELQVLQEQYCDAVLKDSEIGNLLKLKMEPVLVGFLYAKITSSIEKGIRVEYTINPIDTRGKIETHEMIELIGVLFDNAVEAIEQDEDKRILLKLENRENGTNVEIANISRVYSNSEMEKFCLCGYSTKGENRGIGLSRVKEIVKKTNATLLIRNKELGGKNYLCFEIRL